MNKKTKKSGTFVVLKQQNMPTLQLKISEAEIERLNYERFLYPEPMIQKRILAVYIKALLDWNYETIGLITDLHPNTVGHWIRIYREKGFEGLLTNNYGTNQSAMEGCTQSILSSFLKQPPVNSIEAAERIETMTGIRRSLQQVRVFMKRHGLKVIKCGHIPAKADNAALHEWVETELKPAIEAARRGEIHLLFLDAAHLYFSRFFALCGAPFGFL